jgi:predicted NBD/HSP70 family sugar kinase
LDQFKKLGLNNEGIQRANRILVLKLMLENRVVSRPELIKKTGLQKATITNIVNEFLDMGIIKEVGYTKRESERKTGALRLEIPSTKIISLRITSKNYLIYTYNLTGEIDHEIRQEYSGKPDIERIMDEITSHIQDLIIKHGKDNILGLCIGLPGPYIRRNTKHIAIVTGFEQLSKIDVQNRFTNCFDFLVITEHDAKLSAFAEWKNLNEQPADVDKILVGIQTIGVGMGAGIVFNGKIVRGALGIAGEIGHMGINIHEVHSKTGGGEYEQYASIAATRRYLEERLFEFSDSVLTAASDYQDIKKAYLDGDALAVNVMKKLAWMVGYGIANIIYVLNPDTIIIGSDYPNYEPFLNEVMVAIKQRMHSDIFEGISIRFSEITQDTTLLGGYYLVLETLIQNQQILNYVKRISDNNTPACNRIEVAASNFVTGKSEGGEIK